MFPTLWQRPTVLTTGAVLKPVVVRYGERSLRSDFRGDATFVSPDLYEFLVAEYSKYVIYLKANNVFRDVSLIFWRAPLVVGPTMSVVITPASAVWPDHGTRSGALLPRWNGTPVNCIPRVGSIVTNLSRSVKRVVGENNSLENDEVLYNRTNCKNCLGNVDY